MKGPTSRAQERADRRREEILEVAGRIFAEKGYHATGIADIAAALGLGHGTFYRYFKNKHDIALAVFDRLLGRVGQLTATEEPTSAASLEDYRAQARRLVDRWVSLVEEHPHLIRFLHEQSVTVDAGRLALLVELVVEYTARFLDNGKARGFLRASLDVRPTSEMIVALIFDGTRRALSDAEPAVTRRRVEAGIALMFDGIRREPAPRQAAALE